jgi:nitrite reductase/ring-hydroxylating ferredoxin subunit
LPPEFTPAARLDELREGEMLLVSIEGQELILLRIGDEVLAAESICTHALGYLDQGTVIGCEVECPLHAGRFDLRSGKAIQEPAVDPLTVYQVRVENGTVLVGPPKTSGE